MKALGKKELRGALLGTGDISQYHMTAWQTIPGVKIVALANRTRARAEAMGRRFGIPNEHIYTDYCDLLARERLDFVDVATAPQIHREQVLSAAAAGVNVLCQKPFAPDLAQAVEMSKACELAGVHLVVNENWRWRRWYRDIKSMLEDGFIGRPLYARFQCHRDHVLPGTDSSLPELLTRQMYTRDMPRLILFEWGIHLLDTMRYLFGEVNRVFASMRRVSSLVRGEDMALVILEFANGVTGIIDISWGSRVPKDRALLRGNVDPFVVEGDAGSIELDPYQGDLLAVTTLSGTEKRSAHPDGLAAPDAFQECFRNAQAAFIRCLRTSEVAETDARDNLKTLSLTMAAYESAASGQPVEIK